MNQMLKEHLGRPLIVLLGLLFIVGCDAKDPHEVSVSVKSNQGLPVKGATVRIDGKIRGQTNEEGMLSGTMRLLSGTNVKVEVVKSSKDFYYAPFVRKIDVPGTPMSAVDRILSSIVKKEKKVVPVHVNAVLYAVPKPKMTEKAVDDASSGSTGDEVASTTSSSQKGGGDGNTGSLKQPTEEYTRENPGKPADKAQEIAVNDSGIAGESSEAKDIESKDIEANGKGAGETGDSASLEELADLGSESNSSRKTGLVNEKAQESSKRPSGLQEVDVLEKSTPVVTPVELNSNPSEVISSADYPQKQKKIAGQYVFTVQVFHQSKAVKGVKMYMGDTDRSELKEICTTNARGRCIYKFSKVPRDQKVFVAKKEGFVTSSHSSALSDNGLLRVELNRGVSIDVFATVRRYHYVSGFPGATVMVNGNAVGKTDDFGRFSYVYSGAKDDYIDLMIKSENYLPEIFQTNFVVSGPMTLVKQFSPTEPPAARVVTLPLRVMTEKSDATERLKTSVKNAFLGEISRSTPFVNVGLSVAMSAARKADLTISQVVSGGWMNTDLKAKVDAIIVPTLSEQGGSRYFDVSLVDARGRVLGAVHQKLAGDVAGVLSVATSEAVEKLTRFFPFEGTVDSFVAGESGNEIKINLGSSHGRLLQQGDKISIWGLQKDQAGLKADFSEIGVARVESISTYTSTAKIISRAPRSKIGRGDLIQLVRKVGGGLLAKSGKPLKTSSFNVKVVDAEKTSSPVAKVNIYHDGEWIGITNERGVLSLPKSLQKTKLKLTAAKSGYDRAEVDVKPGKRAVISLYRRSIYLKIDSKPSGAEITIDGRVLGRTPFVGSIQPRSSVDILTLTDVDGHKDYKVALDYSEDSIDLDGSKRIILEPDYFAVGKELMDSGRVDAAIKKWSEIPENHSDYLRAVHQLGEVYLTVKEDIDAAIEKFESVTSRKEVASFQDKKYVGSFINLGISYFKKAELLGKEKAWDKVAQYYQKSVSSFEKAKPYMRFIEGSKFDDVNYLVSFHSNLARHRTALIVKDKDLLKTAYDGWRDFVSTLETPSKSADRDAYQENAKLYLRQARISLRQKAL